MLERLAPPDIDDLVRDLHLLRRRGIIHTRRIPLPALTRAARSAGVVSHGQRVEAPAIESLLRRGIVDLDGGKWDRAANALFGFASEARGSSPGQLRREAAEAFEVSESRWRNHWEKVLIEQIAILIAKRCHEFQVRLAHLDLERRVPTATRLAVAWLERFETYYAIWTPVYALAADLTAYRSTLLETDRPYDQEPTEFEPVGYSQEQQAAGYATDAFFHLADFLAQMEKFQTRFGGLWLLSDRAIESEVADAVASIRLSSPNNERDDSYMRRIHDEVGGELDSFRSHGAQDPVLNDMHREWQTFVAICECTWNPQAATETYFPIHLTHPDIDPMCPVHTIISAANTYCMLVDDDWGRIADWYHITGEGSVPLSPDERYQALRAWSKELHGTHWPPWS